ncbi:hypothetical protein [Sinimarinibacterium sp. NLF-5-8]|uniref:hypothetical protein n=1 Tax=Sinimarinibacterium sp. NLF-5-8 TaxID=2698684 RepID=UPI00137BFB64|nr:hypothetical protein [Sinimarinibacterium sp. NLF-5-8]QHS09331.1 hypothetical protein GT972_03610 [Sinimarinibacterium sp. NLF-5-8]
MNRSNFFRTLLLGSLALLLGGCVGVPYGVAPAADSVYYVRDPWAGVSPHAQCYRSWQACYDSPHQAANGYYGVPPAQKPRPGHVHRVPPNKPPQPPPAAHKPPARPAPRATPPPLRILQLGTQKVPMPVARPTQKPPARPAPPPAHPRPTHESRPPHRPQKPASPPSGRSRH